MELGPAIHSGSGRFLFFGCPRPSSRLAASRAGTPKGGRRGRYLAPARHPCSARASRRREDTPEDTPWRAANSVFKPNLTQGVRPPHPLAPPLAPLRGANRAYKPNLTAGVRPPHPSRTPSEGAQTLCSSQIVVGAVGFPLGAANRTAAILASSLGLLRGADGVAISLPALEVGVRHSRRREKRDDALAEPLSTLSLLHPPAPSFAPSPAQTQHSSQI
jgi:hypothetical protein